MSRNSIYEIISDAMLVDHTLPNDFILEDEENRDFNKLSYAPGAMDGISIYHMVPSDKEEECTPIYKIFQKAILKNSDKYVSQLVEFLNEVRAISVIPNFTHYIYINPKKFELSKCYETCMKWLKESSEIELMKLAMAILSMMNGLSKDGEHFTVVYDLGQYTEFTFFAIDTISNWDEELGQNVSLHYANTLNDWGKIHSVEALNPRYPNVKEFIIKSGCKDCITPGYLGLVCAEKGDVIDVMRQGTVDDRTFDGVSNIISGLADESPRVGFSAYEYTDELITKYISHAENRNLSYDGFIAIRDLKEYIENKEDFVDGENLIKRIDDILAKYLNPNKFKKELIDVDADNTKEIFEIYFKCNYYNLDVSEIAIKRIEEDINSFKIFVSMVAENENLIDKLLDIYRNDIKTREMDTENPETFNNINLLSTILSALAKYPNKGEDIILRGINHKTVMVKNVALKTVRDWKNRVGLQLKDISKPIYDTVLEHKNIATEEHTLELIDEILS